MLPEIYRDRRFWVAAGVTVVAAAGLAVCKIAHQSLGVPTSSVPEGGSGSFPTQEPTQMPTEPPNPVTGPEFIVEWDGQSWECRRMNNPAYPQTYDSKKPTVLVPLDAMRMLGDVTPPYLIIRGLDGPMKIFSIHDPQNRYVANGGSICVDGITGQ